ncbi:hypothetical protein CASFOL_037156 [Castilleja foliolosa]|uniref:Uncharacterized protein n=1 Tax=Castilleja foliolosa TaxID=1961234 RepID=A0ABD3BN48_9LAMI
MNKASVISDAIEYLEYLQERVRTLEELQTANETAESTVVVDGDNSSTNEIKFPEIEARVREKSVLFKILCQKRKGLLGKILSKVDKLDLVVVNIAVTPFGSLALDISIIAEMGKLRHSTNDMVAALRSAVEGADADEEEEEN